MIYQNTPTVFIEIHKNFNYLAYFLEKLLKIIKIYRLAVKFSLSIRYSAAIKVFA